MSYDGQDNISDIVKETMDKATLLDYKMFINMLEKYPAKIILEQLKLKVEELENG